MFTGRKSLSIHEEEQEVQKRLYSQQHHLARSSNISWTDVVHLGGLRSGMVMRGEAAKTHAGMSYALSRSSRAFNIQLRQSLGRRSGQGHYRMVATILPAVLSTE